MLFVAATVAFAAPAPLLAQAMAPHVADRDVVTLDPAKSYVLVRSSGQTALMLIREPDADDRAAWQARRDEAFAEAVERYPRQMRSYQSRRERWVQTGRRGSAPEAPVEPTQENFQFAPIEIDMMVGIGPLNRFAKEGESVYLSELRPGTYHVYGPVSAVVGYPAVGYCLCMGSVRFDVAAGGITDMGRIINDAGAHLRRFDDQAEPQMDPDNAVTPFTIEPAMTGAQRDPRLVGVTVTPAVYAAGRRFPNYFGLVVDRVNPMPGVIAYRRDVIIDFRADQAAAQAAAEAAAAQATAAAEAAAQAEAAAVVAETATPPS